MESISSDQCLSQNQSVFPNTGNLGFGNCEKRKFPGKFSARIVGNDELDDTNEVQSKSFWTILSK